MTSCSNFVNGLAAVPSTIATALQGDGSTVCDEFEIRSSSFPCSCFGVALVVFFLDLSPVDGETTVEDFMEGDFDVEINPRFVALVLEFGVSNPFEVVVPFDNDNNLSSFSCFSFFPAENLYSSVMSLNRVDVIFGSFLPRFFDLGGSIVGTTEFIYNNLITNYNCLYMN